MDNFLKIRHQIFNLRHLVRFYFDDAKEDTRLKFVFINEETIGVKLCSHVISTKEKDKLYNIIISERNIDRLMDYKPEEYKNE